MPSSRVVRVRSVHEGVAAASLRSGIEGIRAELGVTPEFPGDVEATARESAAAPVLPELDRTDLPMLTIDPPGARDLDQALHIARDGDGYVVHYAIADVAAFVRPGDPVDLEARRRGETLYGADAAVPLHPRVLSEDAASLLPDRVRPALLWRIEVDAEGEGTAVLVERALVRSRAQLSYAEAQEQIDAGTAPESLRLLAELGPLRLAREAARGGVSLPLPDQEITVDGEHWRLTFRRRLPVEEWNAQLSLLTGYAAATLMLHAQVGLLRTLPPADPRDVQRLHRTAHALGIHWPAELLYPDFIRTLDPARPHHAAMVVACTRLLRGSGYTAFDGELPEQAQHAALASEYAHVTAPLRRLGDRFAGEVCVAVCAGRPVPEWVREALPSLPGLMRDSARVAGAHERAVLELAEAGILHERVGEEFAAVVVDVDDDNPRRGEITIEDPAVEATLRADEDLSLGAEVRVRLVSASVEERRIELALVPGTATGGARVGSAQQGGQPASTGSASHGEEHPPRG
ncbi:RNB domain-containing ribonuclease [Nocardioides sp. zg-DK7169]|uniref:RNB domain-containing ribonuclease n=1 Tax=Nocardioides sp. zg-DK7169 TaxID=2736600 RepID=UPI001555D2F6|nr:RNB domain-containing ribonuclease [Nocardioides sp. zg-DK7169]NPC96557.1 RNB domain-containing ribonuclease [Nocardioides sp. zg-DK7169]